MKKILLIHELLQSDDSETEVLDNVFCYCISI